MYVYAELTEIGLQNLNIERSSVSDLVASSGEVADCTWLTVHMLTFSFQAWRGACNGCESFGKDNMVDSKN